MTVWLQRALITITILWVLWLGVLTWFGTHRRAVVTFGGRPITTIPDPVSVGEWLVAAAVSTAVALFFAFMAWLWLRATIND